MYVENGTSQPVQSSPSPWTGLMDWTGMFSLPVRNPNLYRTVGEAVEVMYVENGTSPPVQSSPSPWTGLMDWTGMYSLPVQNPMKNHPGRA
jgi:hypothetical protein